MLSMLDIRSMSKTAVILCYNAKELDLQIMYASAFIRSYAAQQSLFSTCESAFVVCYGAKENAHALSYSLVSERRKLVT